MKKNNLEDFNLFIEEINRDIFDGEITQIVEITYAYKKIGKSLYFNTTVFTDFGGVKYSKNLDYKLVQDKTEKKLKNKISLIDDYINRLDHIIILCDLESGDRIRGDILKETLKYVRNTIEICLFGLVFELEKAGVEIKLTKPEIKNRIKYIEDLEKQNFGGKVKNHKKEVVLCYEFMKNKFDNSSIEKQEKLKFFLEKAEKYLPKDYKYKKDNEVYKKIKKHNDIFDTLINRDDYVKIFDLVFEIYKLPQRTKITNVGSIYDGEDFLEIPKSKKYETKKIISILKLLLHEIMAHTVNLENNKLRLGKFRGAGNLQKEEGLAVLLEKLFDGYNLNQISIIASLPSIFMGEICTKKEFREYLNLNYRYSDAPLLRFKRNYPLNYKGTQHKDTAYSRGILKASKYLQKGGDIKDLFIGKVKFEDIPRMKKIPLIDSSKKEYSPLLISELLYYIILNKGKYDITNEKFLSYLHKKYDFLDLSGFDHPYKKTHIKMKICEILKILSKYFPYIEEKYCPIVFK